MSKAQCMADPCPIRTVLELYATDSLDDESRSNLETHLESCLSCAEQVEHLTRAQLESILGGPQTDSDPVERLARSPILDQVMRAMTDSQDAPGKRSTSMDNDVHAILEPPVAPGDLGSFAGFDVLEIAGRGGMGVVFKAWDRTLQRIVALKVIFPTKSSEATFATRWLEEARIVAALQHDHIVAVHHAGVSKGLPFLIMPFHAEGTLDRFLTSRRSLPPRDVARAGLQLARALAATHSRGILHRDIKPSNVLLEHGLERVRLADFGLARPVRDEGLASRRSTVAGTPHYMSPEQARGEEVDARSDLFSLGALLYHLATGQTIHPTNSSEEALRLAATGQPPRVRAVNPKVPGALAAIIDRLLASRPADRYASAALVAGELEHLAQVKSRVRRRALLTVAAATAACLVVAAIIVVLDSAGQTAIINSLLCQRYGHGFYVRGRFGTYSMLSSAVARARPHDVIEARFSGPQLVSPFRINGRPLTIRAASGFSPIFVAKNNSQPIILVDAPLTLEGLTLCRGGPRVNFAPVVAVESAPLHLLNCRILRVGMQNQELLAEGKFRPSPPTGLPSTRVLLAFQHGSSGVLRNCLVAGSLASAIGLRASTNLPTQIEVSNSVFVVERAFSMKPQAATQVDLRSINSVFVTAGLIELDEPGPISGISILWDSCFLERSTSGFIRVNQAHEGALLRTLGWRETNVVYGGQGYFAVSRDGRLLPSETKWNDFLQLTAGSHRLTDRQAFPATCVRSSFTLSAADLDAAGLREAMGDPPKIFPAFIGEGEPYLRFRRTAEYRSWKSGVEASASQWQKRMADRSGPPE